MHTVTIQKGVNKMEIDVREDGTHVTIDIYDIAKLLKGEILEFADVYLSNKEAQQDGGKQRKTV